MVMGLACTATARAAPAPTDTAGMHAAAVRHLSTAHAHGAQRPQTARAGKAGAARTDTADSPDAAPLDEDDARYFLTRVGFAPDADELAPYVGLTRAQAVDRVLAQAAQAAQATQASTANAAPLPAWIDEPLPTRAQQRAFTPDERRAEQMLRNKRYEALREWWVGQMLTTHSPLTERMTLFWHNHFTSAQEKVPFAQMMARQNQLFRREAIGSFATLLHEVAKDPAMLLYLDGATNRKGHPNENFAREAMELFTLGEGHYSQHDVSEAARAYTGWTLDPDTRQFVFRPELHDEGMKVVLGHAGNFDGDAVLDILLADPQTATFIVSKLWREFVSETPEPAQLAPIADRFRASHYDIAVALRGLFLSDAFWDERNRGTLVKSPVQFVVGTLRAFDVDYDGTAPFVGTMRSLGQNLFYPPNVKGWPGGRTWIDSTTLLAREQFIDRLFRATDGMPRGNPARGGMRTVAARGGMRLPLDTWLARYGTAAAQRPGLSVELQMQHAVSPLGPVDAIDTGATSAAYLRALMMDPTYQLD
jgi:uncharacterized protein (DUF1800 family)